MDPLRKLSNQVKRREIYILIFLVMIQKSRTEKILKRKRNRGTIFFQMRKNITYFYSF